MFKLDKDTQSWEITEILPFKLRKPPNVKNDKKFLLWTQESPLFLARGGKKVWAALAWKQAIEAPVQKGERTETNQVQFRKPAIPPWLPYWGLICTKTAKLLIGYLWYAVRVTVICAYSLPCGHRISSLKFNSSSSSFLSSFDSSSQKK